MCPNHGRLRSLLVTAATITCVTPQLSAQCCAQERWSVKTGTHADARDVDLANVQLTTITQLIVLSPPSPIPPDHRFAPPESTVFVVNTTLTDYKSEDGVFDYCDSVFSDRYASNYYKLAGGKKGFDLWRTFQMSDHLVLSTD
jgi:hypothetical protein